MRQFYFLDEEVGGVKGMAPFVKSPEFANLNVGFALDEGLPSDEEEISLMFAERSICRRWQINAHTELVRI